MHDHTSDLRVAVVTGQHAYDVPAFTDLFQGLAGVRAYFQDLENLAADAGRAFETYDLFLFYNMHRGAPEGRVLRALERLGETEQGILVLHHGLLAFPDWPVWDEVVGIAGRSAFRYYHDEVIPLEIADREHPVTAGLAAAPITDETYTLPDAGPGSRVLVTTAHPRSMRTICWARRHGRARVLCLALGHDATAWADPTFRAVLERGLRWVARPSAAAV
jgi:hypothetical protein